MYLSSRTTIGFAVLMVAFLSAPTVFAARAAALPDFTTLVEEASPAVVNISTRQAVSSGYGRLPHGIEIPNLPEDNPFGDLLRHFFGDQSKGELEKYYSKSVGSGFFISRDGYLLTNYHVIKEGSEIIVRLSDRREFTAEIIGIDKNTDVALLKIDADDVPVVRIGSGSDLKVGEWVLAIGSPFEFDHSVTAGIVSAKGRSLPSENYVPFIQTDVAINPGNSGGPLFNLDGEVVGINSQIYSRTGGFMGLSFAIPIEVAMDVADQLKTKGRVSRGWLGVLIQDVTRELADSLGLDSPRGALIAKVLPDSPAQKAGLRVRDVILRFNGKEVSNSSALPPMVGSSSVDDAAEVVVFRDGAEKRIAVKLGELPSEDELDVAKTAPAARESNRLNISVKDPVPEQRKEFELGPDVGVIVDSVGEGPAADAGIRRGDAILMLNNENVKNVEHFAQLVDGLPKSKTVTVLVQRGEGPVFLALRMPAG